MIWLSYMLDYEIAGLNPWIYHLTNLLFHLANTLLLFIVMNRMTKKMWPSMFAAVLFAVHPLHVESVAWVAERKDVLSTFFWMLAILCYLKYLEKPGLKAYLAIAAVFVLGLMSKPMLVTLPITLLLIDFWPLGRLKDCSVWKLVREKVPLFAITAVGCIVAYLSQAKGGAVGSLSRYPLDVRIENAIISYVVYIRKAIWPDDLGIFYPHPGKNIQFWQVLAAGLLLTAITWLAARLVRRYPYVLMGWLWYVITLLPVIGIVQIGGHALADRFTYVPLIGLIIIAVWGVPDLLSKPCKSADDSPAQAHLKVIAVLVSAVFTFCGYIQTTHWQNSATIFSHTIDVTSKDNSVAQSNLALALTNQNRFEEAIPHYHEALRVVPGNADTRCNLAMTLISLNRLDEAACECHKVIQLHPDCAQAYNHLGVVYAKQGKYEQAAVNFARALEIQPDKATARTNLMKVRKIIEENKGPSIKTSRTTHENTHGPAS